MALTKQDFASLKLFGRFYGLGDFDNPEVVKVDDDGTVHIKWPNAEPVTCIWDEESGSIVRADGAFDERVEKLNGETVSIKPENADQVLKRWYTNGLISDQEKEDMEVAIQQSEREAMERVLITYS